MKDADLRQQSADPQCQTLDLAGAHRLTIEECSVGNLVKLSSGSGQIMLSLHVSSAGVVLGLDGAALAIRTTGALSINAQHIHLHGSQGVAITSDQDLEFKAQGELRTRAQTQSITAESGNVDIEANDDIRLEGERILLNS